MKIGSLTGIAVLLSAAHAQAQNPTPEPAPDPRIEALEARIRQLEERARAADAREAAKEKPVPDPKLPGPSGTLDGYVEANYSYNFNRPRNGITNFRGFDNRSDTFTLSNAVLGATFDYESLVGRVALQIGHTPTSYYLAEPTSAGASGAATTGADATAGTASSTTTSGNRSRRNGSSSRPMG